MSCYSCVTSLAEVSKFHIGFVQGGMPGSVRLRDSEILQRITVRQAEEKRFYGAICAAPAVVLLPWGLHKGKKVVVILHKFYCWWSELSN
jgi:putative intracellular protease/amidase